MIQTAFRFTPDMVQRMKRKARLQGRSVNKYVESLIEKDLEKEEETYEALYKGLSEIKLQKEISPELRDFAEKYNVEFTDEEIEADERLAYLLNK